MNPDWPHVIEFLERRAGSLGVLNPGSSGLGKLSRSQLMAEMLTEIERDFREAGVTKPESAALSVCQTVVNFAKNPDNQDLLTDMFTPDTTSYFMDGGEPTPDWWATVSDLLPERHLTPLVNWLRQVPGNGGTIFDY